VRAPTDECSVIDALGEHLRQEYGLSESQTSLLGQIRPGAGYACVTLRAELGSGPPIRMDRLGVHRDQRLAHAERAFYDCR
jgi:hypothetical protein